MRTSKSLLENYVSNCWFLKKTKMASASTQQSIFALTVFFCARPASKHESNLVDHVCDVVDHVQIHLRDRPEQVAEQVAERIDAPAHCNNHAHVVEGRGNSLAASTVLDLATRFAGENFEEDEAPTSQATRECGP